jgi:hypothetical protein
MFAFNVQLTRCKMVAQEIFTPAVTPLVRTAETRAFHALSASSVNCAGEDCLVDMKATIQLQLKRRSWHLSEKEKPGSSEVNP